MAIRLPGMSLEILWMCLHLSHLLPFEVAIENSYFYMYMLGMTFSCQAFCTDVKILSHRSRRRFARDRFLPHTLPPEQPSPLSSQHPIARHLQRLLPHPFF